MANTDRDTVYSNDGVNRTVYTRENNSTGWFVGIIVALALLAIAYLVFSANSQPSTVTDINNSPTVTTPAPVDTLPAPTDTNTTPMAPADTTTTPMAPADTAPAPTETAPIETAPAPTDTAPADTAPVTPVESAPAP